MYKNNILNCFPFMITDIFVTLLFKNCFLLLPANIIVDNTGVYSNKYGYDSTFTFTLTCLGGNPYSLIMTLLANLHFIRTRALEHS